MLYHSSVPRPRVASHYSQSKTQSLALARQPQICPHPSPSSSIPTLSCIKFPTSLLQPHCLLQNSPKPPSIPHLKVFVGTIAGTCFLQNYTRFGPSLPSGLCSFPASAETFPKHSYPVLTLSLFPALQFFVALKIS